MSYVFHYQGRGIKKIHTHTYTYTLTLTYFLFFPQKIFCLDWEWAPEPYYKSIVRNFQVPSKGHNIFWLSALEGRSIPENERKPGNSFGGGLVLNSMLLKNSLVIKLHKPVCVLRARNLTSFLCCFLSPQAVSLAKPVYHRTLLQMSIRTGCGITLQLEPSRCCTLAADGSCHLEGVIQHLPRLGC